MTSIPYNNDKARCKCGGQLCYDARLTQKLPLGFGFVGGRFQVDFIVKKGWRGQCMECGKKYFAVVSSSQQRRVPKSINRKIKLARQREVAV